MFLSQAGVGLQKMQQISQERATPAVIYSGDLNTPTNHPAYDFLRTGKLTPELRKRVKDMENWEGMAEVSSDWLTLGASVFLFCRRTVGHRLV